MFVVCSRNDLLEGFSLLSESMGTSMFGPVHKQPGYPYGKNRGCWSQTVGSEPDSATD